MITKIKVEKMFCFWSHIFKKLWLIRINSPNNRYIQYN